MHFRISPRADSVAHLGQSPFRSYGSTSIDPSPSLPSSVFSSTADLRSKQLPRSTEYEPTTRAIGSGSHHDYDARQGPVSFPKRIARKLHNWIGESGITCDFKLPRRRIRADKEEGANGRVEGQYERERLSAGSARGAPDEGEGGEVEPDDDWWSDRLGQEGLILPLLIITFSCAYVVPHLALGLPAMLIATLASAQAPGTYFASWPCAGS